MYSKCGKLSILLALTLLVTYREAIQNDFVRTKGIHFELNGRPLYFNGFNAYWLMYQAADPSTRDMVTTTLKQASDNGMNLIRTWAFNDGAYRALQISPSTYDENVFKAYIHTHGLV